MHDDSLEAVLALIQRLQAVLLGLKQLPGYVGQGEAKEMVEELIAESESKLAQFEGRLVQ